MFGRKTHIPAPIVEKNSRKRANEIIMNGLIKMDSSSVVMIVERVLTTRYCLIITEMRCTMLLLAVRKKFSAMNVESFLVVNQVYININRGITRGIPCFFLKRSPNVKIVGHLFLLRRLFLRIEAILKSAT